MANDYDDLVWMFEAKCTACHGDKFYRKPRKKFMKRAAFFFDLKNNGRLQRVPRRMGGVRLNKEEVRLFKNWLKAGAPNEEGEKAFDLKTVRSIFR